MNGALTVGLLGLFLVAALAGPVKQAAGKKMVCYYGSWAVYRSGTCKFDVENIDPFACTHIIYGFVGLDEVTNTVKVLDPYNDLEEDWGRGAMKRFTALKQQNPNLVTLLAIGGWNEGSEKYSKMAMDPAKRRTFVQSVVPLLESQNFDGFDMDWEYPSAREGSSPVDKQNFVLLLQELRAELEPKGYLLTAAVSAGAPTIDAAYDIPAVSRLLDAIHVMAYDFHGAWEAFTGHHSPLHGDGNIDTGDNITLNSDYAINHWIQNGADPSKLVLGIGTYGRGFQLDNVAQNGLYAPAARPILAGPCTQENGFWGYNEICEKQKANPSQWTVVDYSPYQVPYAYSGDMWIGYDNVESVNNKAKYVNEKGLGGAFVWSLETDDFNALCGSEKFPLIKSIYKGLNGEYPPRPTTTSTTQDPNASTRASTSAPSSEGPAPPPSDICKRSGLNPDPSDDCSEVFYACQNVGGEWVVTKEECPAGIVFNPDTQACDYPENVPGCD